VKAHEQRAAVETGLPFPSPTLVGCAIAVERGYFMKLGAFDEGMRIWGGENIELGFRTWMCGGQVKTVTCSRVGHVFKVRRFLPRSMHCMQRGLATRKSVGPSVRLSLEREDCNKTEESSAKIFITYERLFILVYEKKNGWWGRPLLPEIFVNLTPLERNRRFSVDIFARSASAVTDSK